MYAVPLTTLTKDGEANKPAGKPESRGSNNNVILGPFSMHVAATIFIASPGMRYAHWPLTLTFGAGQAWFLGGTSVMPACQVVANFMLL